jgi:hypothetical protein
VATGNSSILSHYLMFDLCVKCRCWSWFSFVGVEAADTQVFNKRRLSGMPFYLSHCSLNESSINQKSNKK